MAIVASILGLVLLAFVSVAASLASYSGRRLL